MSTGVAGLDGQLDGGITPGTTMLLMAEPTNAPYRFLEHFVAEGLNKNETVIYYNLERPRFETLTRVTDQVRHPETARDFRYFDCYAVKLRHIAEPILNKVGITNHAPDVTQHVLPQILELPREGRFRLVIESLTEIIQAYGLDSAMNMLNTVAGIVRMMNGVAVVLIYPSQHNEQAMARARQLCDSVIELSINRSGTRLQPVLHVLKMKGMGDELRSYFYSETPTSIRVDPTRRVA